MTEEQITEHDRKAAQANEWARQREAARYQRAPASPAAPAVAASTVPATQAAESRTRAVTVPQKAPALAPDAAADAEAERILLSALGPREPKSARETLDPESERILRSALGPRAA